MSQQSPVAADGYHLVDSGVRCIRPPCPSVRATPLNGGPSVDVTDVVPAPELPQGDKDLVGRLMSLPQGIRVRGSMHREGAQHIFTVKEVLPR